MKLRVATCQFPVGAEIERNARYIVRQMRVAKRRGADVAHFCEGALSGYAGADLPSFRSYHWDRLRVFSEAILSEAAELELWVLLGSTHPLSGSHKPHNSVYVIDDRGRLIDRYDKMFCSGDAAQTQGDLAHYSAGEHFCVFDIRGVRCGVLICYDYRYPELYREYKARGVELMFHSYHAGNASPARVATMERQVGKRFHRLNPGTSFPEITMPSSMHAAAASSHVWISCSNTSARFSCFPAFFIRADGVCTGKLRRHQAGVLISTVDTDTELYDSTREWRARAMKGVFHTGARVRDARSRDRRSL